MLNFILGMLYPFDILGVPNGFELIYFSITFLTLSTTISITLKTKYLPNRLRLVCGSLLIIGLFGAQTIRDSHFAEYIDQATEINEGLVRKKFIVPLPFPFFKNKELESYRLGGIHAPRTRGIQLRKMVFNTENWKVTYFTIISHLFFLILALSAMFCGSILIIKKLLLFYNDTNKR